MVRYAPLGRHGLVEMLSSSLPDFISHTFQAITPCMSCTDIHGFNP